MGSRESGPPCPQLPSWRCWPHPLFRDSYPAKRGSDVSQSSPSSEPVSEAIDGVITLGSGNGWAITVGRALRRRSRFSDGHRSRIRGGTLFTFNLYQYYGYHSIGDFRLSITQDDRTIWGADGLDISGAWTVLNPLTAVATNGPTLAIQADASILASGTDPTSTVYTVTAWTNLTAITGIRLETLTDASLPGGGPGRNSNGNFVLSEITVSDEFSNGSPFRNQARCRWPAWHCSPLACVPPPEDRELPLQARLNRLAEAVK